MKTESSPIYTVTTIKFGYKELLVGPNKGKRVFAILNHRVVGWFYNKLDAVKTVEGNCGDLYECGSWPYAVIEEVPEGQYPYCGKSWWYSWRNKKYRKSRKPKKYRHVVNFAIG
jgi:hypothetical protein